MTRDGLVRLIVTWITFWEGALIAHFFGLRWALAFCLAWLLIAVGFYLSKWKRLA